MSPALHPRSARLLRTSIALASAVLLLALSAAPIFAQSPKPAEACSRPAVGGTVAEPPDLRSQAGVLQVDLTLRNGAAANGQMRYCYVAPDGSHSPTLRLHPGDLLILHLKNALTEPATPAAAMHHHASSTQVSTTDPCQRAE